MNRRKRRNRPLTWPEILYGLMIIGIIVAWLIDSSINGSGATPIEDRYQ